MPLDLHRRQGGSFNPPWFGVAPGDALTFAGVPLLLGVVSVLSAYLPARRAARSIRLAPCARSSASVGRVPTGRRGRMWRQTSWRYANRPGLLDAR
jgi:hypothetical protein